MKRGQALDHKRCDFATTWLFTFPGPDAFAGKSLYILSEVCEAANHFGMRLPELYCGFPRVPGQGPVLYPVACPPQAWSSGTMYADRYRIILERMIAKKLYDGACLIVSNESIKDKTPNHLCLFPELSGDRFIDLLLRHIKGYYSD